MSCVVQRKIKQKKSVFVVVVQQSPQPKRKSTKKRLCRKIATAV